MPDYSKTGRNGLTRYIDDPGNRLANQMTHRSSFEAMPGPFNRQLALDSAAIGLSAIPIVGDLAGLGADAHMYYNEPESRTWGNYGLSALGAVPFIPSMAGAVRQVGKAADALPMDEASRMARAREQGFDVDAPQYKGMWPFDWTKEVGDYPGPEIKEINRTTEFPAFNKGEKGVDIAGFMASDPKVASKFAGEHGAVYPVFTKRGRELVIDAKGDFAGNIQFGETGKPFRDAVRGGDYDSIRIINTADEGDITVALRPENIRSKFAKFDPRKAGSGNLLAGAAGGSMLAAGALNGMARQNRDEY